MGVGSVAGVVEFDKAFFRDRIDDEPIFYTDSHKSYIQFSQNLGIKLQQIKRGQHKE